jgi:hypothetical protein
MIIKNILANCYEAYTNFNLQAYTGPVMLRLKKTKQENTVPVLHASSASLPEP